VSVRSLGFALFIIFQPVVSAALPPVVCPAGGPIGSVDLRVMSPRGGNEALPLRTINRLEEGDRLLYRPLLRSGEERKGEVTLVLVPANKAAAGEDLRILNPKPANKPQEWSVPWRVSVVAFVYGPSGLIAKKVQSFLERDDELVAQLADYAEKTAQTEALITALSSPSSSSAAVQSALQGFSSQYGLNVQIDRNAPSNQQALTLFRTLNPAIASYDPITPHGSQSYGQTAGLATSVATLFFGSPVGLAAGGTAMLLELRSLAFPHAEFRSSFSQTLPNDGLGLCGRRDPVPPHTKVAYLWASRVPNAGPPQLAINRENSLPTGVRSPVPVTSADADWRFVDRARSWALVAENEKPIPVSVHKLGNSKMLELELTPTVKPGKYSLVANWDWDRFPVEGEILVRPLNNFGSTRPVMASLDLLVAKTGKVPVTLEGGDFEFVTKVEIEKVNDKFASPEPVPYVLPHGLRKGVQNRMDIQVNTIDLDAGEYQLLISQLDGTTHPVSIKILPPPPVIENLPVVVNQGASALEFRLKGQRLDLLQRLEVARGTVQLGPACANQQERIATVHMANDIAAGTVLALKAYIQDRSEPLTLSDAIRIAGPRPNILEMRVSQPPDQEVQLEPGELPGGAYLSAMLRVEHLQSNGTVKLSCGQPGSNSTSLHLGDRSGPLSLQQLAPGQLFLSFDTGAWLNGCVLQASIANGSEGESDAFKLGRVVRVPKIERFELPTGDAATGSLFSKLTGQSLETIEKIGWNAENGELVTGLPLPIAGDASRQSLRILIAPPPDSGAFLYLWLRGESQARPTKVHAQ
jgi:hypothetical protein